MQSLLRMTNSRKSELDFAWQHRKFAIGIDKSEKEKNFPVEGYHNQRQSSSFPSPYGADIVPISTRFNLRDLAVCSDNAIRGDLAFSIEVSVPYNKLEIDSYISKAYGQPQILKHLCLSWKSFVFVPYHIEVFTTFCNSARKLIGDGPSNAVDMFS